jgi:hypothetical protein
MLTLYKRIVLVQLNHADLMPKSQNRRLMNEHFPIIKKAQYPDKIAPTDFWWPYFVVQMLSRVSSLHLWLFTEMVR